MNAIQYAVRYFTKGMMISFKSLIIRSLIENIRIIYFLFQFKNLHDLLILDYPEKSIS